MRLTVFCARLAAILALGFSVSVQAYERGDWIWRASLLQQQPEVSGDMLSDGYIGAQYQFGTEIMPALQLDYFVFDSLSLGIAAPVQRLDQRVFVDGDAGSRRIGKVEMLPITFSLNWYMGKFSNLRPYLIGAWQYSWVRFESTREGALPGLERMSVDDGSGLGAGLGLEWDRSGNWSWNFSAVQFVQHQDVTLTVNGNKDTVDASPHVLTLNFGIARRF